MAACGVEARGKFSLGVPREELKQRILLLCRSSAVVPPVERVWDDPAVFHAEVNGAAASSARHGSPCPASHREATPAGDGGQPKAAQAFLEPTLPPMQRPAPTSFWDDDGGGQPTSAVGHQEVRQSNTSCVWDCWNDDEAAAPAPHFGCTRLPHVPSVPQALSLIIV
ncbi:unnamed protein product [Symbiodinium natans]|uniref:Uncharacterized protein n=1 Tax=Symbiodinium natans TaxID=878477 RepID=A0A812KWJ9_9DINO|nr:unnamed protein product [Symbiodinium natans]